MRGSAVVLPRRPALLSLILTGLTTSSGVRQFKPAYSDEVAHPVRGKWPELLAVGEPPLTPEKVSYLKAHLRSGEMILFSYWSVPSPGDPILQGQGVPYGVDRTSRAPGNDNRLAIPMDSIASLETQQQEGDGGAKHLHHPGHDLSSVHPGIVGPARTRSYSGILLTSRRFEPRGPDDGVFPQTKKNLTASFWLHGILQPVEFKAQFPEACFYPAEVSGLTRLLQLGSQGP